MRNLENILEYQKYDIQLKRLNDELFRSNEKKTVKKIKDTLGKVQVIVIEQEKKAAICQKKIDNLRADFESLTKEFDVVNSKVVAEDSEEEKAKYCREVDRIKNRLSSIANEYDKCVTECKDLVNRALEATRINKEKRTEFTAANKAWESLYGSKKPAIDKLKEQLKALEATVDADLFAEYKTIRADGILPVIVEAKLIEKASTHNCFCGFNLTQKKDDELRAAKLCTCESCQRLVYII